MSNDLRDTEWRCGCGYTNLDHDELCSGCGEARYLIEEEEADSLSNLYNDESNRMANAQDLKR